MARIFVTWTTPLFFAALAGCATNYESSVRQEFAARHSHFPRNDEQALSGPRPRPSSSLSRLDRGLPAYVAMAMENNPEIQAEFERWQASVHRISRARRLPDPTISFGYFVRSVETRVGPQLAKISLQQAFPWPTKLSAGADAASANAQAAQRRVESKAVRVAQQVTTAYWNLWLIRRIRSIRKEHLLVVRGLSETVAARISVGTAMVADKQQIDLTAARIEDEIMGLDEAEKAAEARLRSSIGTQEKIAVPTPYKPASAALPSDSYASLVASARTHPTIASVGLMAKAADYSAKAEDANRMPSFMIGADWIITGQAAMPNVPDSGKDAVMVGAGVRVPLWQGSYSDSVAAAHADARARRADQQAMTDRAVADLESALSRVRDAVRRVDLYENTLLPQAQSTYDSVLGAYTIGKGTVAQALLAQRDLLELRIKLETWRADHARAWAELEAVVGRSVKYGAKPTLRESQGARP
jgi:outer membrane protein, heavy metal efflux system